MDNGGYTYTQALSPDSPAVDAIPLSSYPVEIDRRWSFRLVVKTSADSPCDIGTFELQTEP
jgi:hypothetical protein